MALFLLSLNLLGCSSSQESRREMASIEDIQKSSVQIFPVMATNEGLQYYIYVQLKNELGEYVDCDPKDVELKTSKGKSINFEYEKLNRGRFYLIVDKTKDVDSSQMDFFIGGRTLKEKFILSNQVPDSGQSKITLISNARNKLSFSLRLTDKAKRPVEIIDKPEIIIEGLGSLEEIKKIKEGLWEFSVIYPDENQIMYISVRAQGVYLQNLFRFQHVEK